MWRYWLVVTLLWALPIVAVVALLDPAELSRTGQHDAEPSVAVAGSRTDDGLQPATAKLAWSSVVQARGFELTGRVTAVLAMPERAIVDGDPLLAVDGQTRLAHVADRPFHRVLRYGDSGDDVQELDRWLVALGYAPSSTLSDGRFSAATRQAVRGFERIVAATPVDGTFQPADVIFVPGGFVVGVVAVSVGDTLSGEDVILESKSEVIGATLELVGDPLRRTLIAGQAIVLVFPSGRSYDLGPDWTTAIGELDWEGETAAIGQPELGGLTVKLRVPIHVATVVASALFTDSAGLSCVVVVRDGERLEPVQVDLRGAVGAEPGVLYLPSELAGLKIVANPASSRIVTSCR